MPVSPSVLQRLTRDYQSAQANLERSRDRAAKAASALADAQAAASGDGTEPPSSNVSEEQIRAIAGRKQALTKAQAENDRTPENIARAEKARDDAWKKLCEGAGPG